MLKVSFIFTQVNDARRTAGWSETWYADILSSQLPDRVHDWLKARMRMLSGFCACTGYRYQVIGGRGRIFRNVVPGAAAQQQDIPQMAIQCVVNGTAVLNTKSFELRGVPDDIIKGGKYSPDAQFTAGATLFGRTLNGGQWRFKAVDLSKPAIDIISIGVDGTFTLAAGMVYNEQDYVTLLRTKNVNGLNISGKYFVKTKTSNTVGILANWTGGAVSLKGKMRLNATIYPIIEANSFEVIQATTRKVGRPFDAYRGRRTKR